ncbi:unnamed protein product [Cuscuta epithymum]|uniref:hAT-like transposase RNase-H fold domain-containing protein n=1 Tax=Cuscuta epithymum TaxID=186058 RepID=A0AAV0BUT7_9ASTE|nr:unnamed protein product [Cuscuta epithymum]
MKSDRPSTSTMGTTMKSKLDKYWGDPEKMNFLIFFANVLDPRDKFEYLPFQLNALYTEKKDLINGTCAATENASGSSVDPSPLTLMD